MPDLDQIKQEEQACGIGAGGSRAADPAIPPAGRDAHSGTQSLLPAAIVPGKKSG